MINIESVKMNLGSPAKGMEWVAISSMPTEDGDEFMTHFIQKPIIKLISPQEILDLNIDIEVSNHVNGGCGPWAIMSTASDKVTYDSSRNYPICNQSRAENYQYFRVRENHKFGHNKGARTIPEGLILSYYGVYCDVDQEEIVGGSYQTEYPNWKIFRGWFEVHGTDDTHRYYYEVKP